MSDMPETDTGAAFAAGIATATAEQAQETAVEAEARAENAENAAVQAASRAADAEQRANDAEWNAREAVDALTARFDAGMAEIRELISPKQDGGGNPAGEPATAASAVPAPERKEAQSPAVVGTDDDKPKKRSGYGSRRWFGN